MTFFEIVFVIVVLIVGSLFYGLVGGMIVTAAIFLKKKP